MAEPTLDDIITWLQVDIKKLERFAVGHPNDAYERDVEIEHAALATLQRHKRALAVVEAARKAADVYRSAILMEALAAFDAADTGEDGR